MAFFVQTGPTAQGRLSEMLGESIGEGIAGRFQKKENQQKQSALSEQLFGNDQLQNLSIPEQLELYKAQNKPPPGGPTNQPLTQEERNRIGKVLSENKNASSEELGFAFDKAGVPRTQSNQYVETRRRKEEIGTKSDIEKEKAVRKELAPFKADIAEKASTARQGIQTKEQMLDIINRNGITDPTVAALLDALPFKLGERFLSNDAVAYRGLLVEEFKDLKNIFKGQTRTAELDILEKKLPALYLNDEQKKAIIESRSNALNKDVLRAEAAAELEQEKPQLGLLQFENELAKRVKKKEELIFNKMMNSFNEVIGDAERIKSETLDEKNPEHVPIIKQILMEAGGDRAKAKKLATQKGYKI